MSTVEAKEMQERREAADLANHVERIEWLEGASPRWSCGAPVDSYMRNEMLIRSREAVARATT